MTFPPATLLRSLIWIALASSSLSAGATNAPGPEVCTEGGAQVVVISTDGEPRRATCEELQTENPPATMHHGWRWSATDPPRRFQPDNWQKPDRGSEVAETLRLQMDGISDDAANITVVAGPQEMWQSVPEKLMPRWLPGLGGSATLPRISGNPWRLRILSDRVASEWIDVPPGRDRMIVRMRPSIPLEIMNLGPEGSLLGRIVARVFLTEGASGGRAAQPVAMAVGDGGRLVIEAVPSDLSLRLVLESGDFASRMIEGRVDEFPSELRFIAGARIGGRVVDGGTGEPIEGAVVSVDYWPQPSLPWAKSKVERSDASGSWGVGGLPRGDVVVAVRHPGFGSFSSQVTIGEQQQLDLGPVSLHRGADVKIGVHDDLGRPVGGATVGMDNAPAAVSDDEGRASLTGVPLTGVELEVAAEAHLPLTLPIRAPFSDVVEVRLVRAFHLTARFLDSDGLPVVGGRARIETGTSASFRDLDGEGRLTVDLTPDAEYTLVLQGPTTPAVRLGIPAGAPGERRGLGVIEAPRGYVVEGMVISAETGEPLAAARVWTLRPSPQGPVISWMQKDLIETSTAEDGRFVLGGLPPGRVTLRVEAPGAARLHLEAELSEDAGRVRDVGVVCVPNGNTLWVEVSSRDTQGMTAELDLQGEGLPADVLHASVHDGEAVFHRIAPGSYNLVVRRGPKEICAQEVSIGDSEESVECEGSDVYVTGTVAVGDRPGGSGTLVWRSSDETDGGYPEGIMTVATPSGLRQQSTFSTRRMDVVVPVDRSGGFQTLDVSSGAWRVAWYPESGGAGAPVRVDVPEVEEFEVDLHFYSIEIVGSVVDEDGMPLPEARVRDLVSGSLAIAGSSGEFHLTGLSPGPAKLQARFGLLESEVFPVTLETNRQADPPTLVVRENPDGVLRVEVVDETGRPVSSALVFLQTGTGTDQIATTDFTGVVIFRLSEPTPPHVRAAAFAGDSWILGSLCSTADLDGSLRLAPRPKGSIIVVSSEASGSPAIVSSEGWDLSWLLTRVGMRPVVGPNSELRLSGVPEGVYAVKLRDATATVSVRRDRESVVELEGG